MVEDLFYDFFLHFATLDEANIGGVVCGASGVPSLLLQCHRFSKCQRPQPLPPSSPCEDHKDDEDDHDDDHDHDVTLPNAIAL